MDMNKIYKQPMDLPKGAWKVVFLLFFVGCLSYLDRTMITTMRGSIIAAVPMSNAQFGLLSSVFLWVYGICSPFAGYLADRFKRSVVIISSLFLWSLVTFLTAYAASFEQLLFCRALLGACEACYVPAAMALIVDYHKGPTRSRATGLQVSSFLVGQSFGFLGGWIAEKYTWNASFSIFGLTGIVYAILLLPLLKDLPKIRTLASSVRSDISLPRAMRSLFSNSSYVLLILIWGMLYIVGWVIIGWMPSYYQEHFKLSQGLAGLYATGYIYPLSILGVIAGGVLTDYWFKSNRNAPMLLPVIGLCIAAPAIFFASSSNALPVAIALFMLYAFTRAFSDVNIMPILCLTADEKYRATGFGILNFFACMIGGLGLYYGGVLKDMKMDLGMLFQFTAMLLIVTIALLLLITRLQKVTPSQR